MSVPQAVVKRQAEVMDSSSPALQSRKLNREENLRLKKVVQQVKYKVQIYGLQKQERPPSVDENGDEVLSLRPRYKRLHD